MARLVNAKLQVVTPIADEQTARRRYASTLKATLKSAVKRTQKTVNQRLKKPAGPVKYPIAWTSDRQRRAFFATNGFGRGIPTRRSGAVQRGWTYTSDVNADALTGEVTLDNRVPYAKYVYGDFTPDFAPQQRFHRITGWERANKVADDLFAEVIDYVDDTFVRALENNGFIGGGS